MYVAFESCPVIVVSCQRAFRVLVFVPVISRVMGVWIKIKYQFWCAFMQNAAARAMRFLRIFDGKLVGRRNQPEIICIFALLWGRVEIF